MKKISRAGEILGNYKYVVKHNAFPFINFRVRTRNVNYL